VDQRARSHGLFFSSEKEQKYAHVAFDDVTRHETLAIIRVTETGHLADDGNQAPDARELSLTIFNGKKFKQTIKAQDRGFRGDPGSTGTSSKDPGQDERERSFPSTEYESQNQPITCSQR